ncbi:hypothetical protein A2U01_0038588, partial [Trifolium medium]|nr:hypothetical protein [Trifolium medium]
MDNMDNFNHLLLDGMDAACEEKLIMATTLALSFVSNQRRNIVLQRNDDGIYSLRLDRQQPRDRYAV